MTTLAVGLVGMASMAFGGGTRGRDGGGHSAMGHGHAGHTHAGHSHAGHLHSSHPAHAATSAHPAARATSAKQNSTNLLLTLMSPRLVFSVFVGMGASGMLLRPLLGNGLGLFAAAVALGVVFERALITPIWNFSLRFASEPALSLESVLQGDATAVTAFDANGNGLVAVEVDGRLVQLLGTLQTVDRELRARVVAGAALRIEAVDTERNRCTVSLR